jgi:hypothetical protein
MDCVVAPLDQTLLVAEDDVRTTDPPEQNVVGPPAEIEGVVGSGVTVTAIADDGAEVQLPFVTATVYEPEAVTVMDCVVAPVDQMLPVAAEEVRVTDPPEQNVVGPPAVIVGVAGVVFTVTTVPVDVAEQPALIVVTV